MQGSPQVRYCILTAGTPPPSPTRIHWSVLLPLATSADQILVFQQDWTTGHSISFCWTDNGTHLLKIVRFLQIQQSLSTCVPGFGYLWPSFIRLHPSPPRLQRCGVGGWGGLLAAHPILMTGMLHICLGEKIESTRPCADYRADGVLIARGVPNKTGHLQIEGLQLTGHSERS